MTLLEREEAVGGSLVLAAQTPGGQWFGELAGYFQTELLRTGVDLRLGARLSRVHAESVAPEHVVVATGARQEPPVLPGVEQGTTCPDEDVLADPSFAPERVVVLSSDRRAASVASALADRGARVTLVDTAGAGIARDASGLMRRAYRQQLALRGIRVVRGRPSRVHDGGLVPVSGEEIAADAVVVSGAPRPERHVVDEVRTLGLEPVVVGDAKQARSVTEAIAEGQAAVEDL